MNEALCYHSSSTSSVNASDGGNLEVKVAIRLWLAKWKRRIRSENQNFHRINNKFKIILIKALTPGRKRLGNGEKLGAGMFEAMVPSPPIRPPLPLI